MIVMQSRGQRGEIKCMQYALRIRNAERPKKSMNCPVYEIDQWMDGVWERWSDGWSRFRRYILHAHRDMRARARSSRGQVNGTVYVQSHGRFMQTGSSGGGDGGGS